MRSLAALATPYATAAYDEERLVVYERFVLNLPPRQIQERHPHVFPTVSIIYTTQRNLCDRQRRNDTLREFAPE